MNNTFKLATIGGIQIFIHWTWLLAFAFFTWSLGAYYHNTFHGWGAGASYLVGAISTILLFVTVLLHELGHSFTARSLDLPVDSISLFIFGGVSNLTWEPQTPRVEFLVTFAGPLTSLILAGIFYLLHAFIGWFLYNSAAVSAQQAVMEQVLRGVDGADVMDEVATGIAPTVPVESLVFDHLLGGNCRAMAVQNPGETLVGLVTLTDLRHVRQEDWATTPVSRIMTPAAKLRTVTPTEDLRQAIELLAENRYHQLPVVQDGWLVGMLNRDHVMQYLQVRQLQNRQRETA